MLTRFIKTVALVIPAVALVGCAGHNRPSTFGLDESNASLVRRTCTDIMGLNISAEFEACGGSLANTMLFLQNAELTSKADESCEQNGLAHGTAERAKCVVMFRSRTQNQAGVDSSTSAQSQADSSLLPQALPAKHYVTMNHLERQQRAQLACAQLGLHPAWGSFGSCVNNLQVAIADIRHWNLP